MPLRALEICAGAGGMALGLRRAGFEHEAFVELDGDACETLLSNLHRHFSRMTTSSSRARDEVRRENVATFDGSPFRDKIDLLAGGVPCQPFSVAGEQLGEDDERDLFSQAMRLVREIMPQAVLLENVPGFASAKFETYREKIKQKLAASGYETQIAVLKASDFGVPQVRPRCLLVAMRPENMAHFCWPSPTTPTPVSVGEALVDIVASRCLPWPGAQAWAARANRPGPTLVGGSKKHGGADLGPSRARAAWAELGVNASSLADEAPPALFPIDGHPRLTLAMCKRLQGFPDDYLIKGSKTSAYRQIGNALPPPVAHAVGREIFRVLTRTWRG